MSASDRKNTISPARRAKRGGKKDSVTSVGTASVRKNICPLMKWKVSAPMRSATGGLAAMETSTPDAMSRSTANIRPRSTVNHQRASRPRSLRPSSICIS